MLIKYWREILIAGLIASIAFSIDSCSKKNDDIDLLKKISKDSIAYYKNKNNELVAQIETHEITVDQLNKYGRQLGFDNDKLKKRVGRLNNLVSYWEGKAGMTDTVYIKATDTVIVHGSDSVRLKYFNWSNKYLTLNELYNPLTDTIKVAYSYNVDFAIYAYRKRQGLFKPKQLVTDIYFSDQNLKVKEFKGIVIKEDPKKWYERKVVQIGIGFIAGYYLGKK